MDNRLSIIKKHGQVCGKCGRALPIGVCVTWSPGEASPHGSAWRCVEGPGACCPRPSEVIDAKKNGKPLPAQADTPLPWEPTPSADAAILQDNVFPTSPAGESVAPPAGDSLTELLASALAPRLEAKLRAKVDAGQVQRIVDERTADLIEAAINQVKEWLKPVQVLEVRLPSGASVQIDGAHPKLGEAVEMLMCDRVLYMHGPAGGGKSHAAEQIAKALGVRFATYQWSKLTTESVIRGFTGANGQKCNMDFQDDFAADDVLIVLEEFDRTPGHLQVLLNNGLANGYLQTTWGIVRRGNNYVLALGNTNLRGRDEYYTESQASEFSTIDRFPFLHWPYDTAHEDSIVEAINPTPAAKAWSTWIRKIQPEALSGKRGKILATPRAMYQGAKALRMTTRSLEALADSYVFKHVDKATRDYFVSAYPLPSIPRSEREAFKEGKAA